jgi:putative Mn2+ efflux pump MntP
MGQAPWSTCTLMLRPDEDELPERVAARSHGMAALGLGVSVSLDELAIGFTIGLLGLPVVLVIGLIAAQAFLASQAGSRLGTRMGKSLRAHAEQVGGLVLIGFAPSCCSASGSPATVCSAGARLGPA